MPILNYITTINAMKTVGEIQARLTAAGASRLMIENNPKREPAALVFELHERTYRLPCRSEAVHKQLMIAKSLPATARQSRRCVWSDG